MKSNLRLLTIVSIAALISAPVAMARDGQMNPNHVPGESIDAGISATLVPAHVLHHVPGESLDAGIAQAPSYVLNSVPGEKIDAGFASVPTYVSNSMFGQKLDSGLGEVTQEEIRRIVDAVLPKTVASSK